MKREGGCSRERQGHDEPERLGGPESYEVRLPKMCHKTSVISKLVYQHGSSLSVQERSGGESRCRKIQEGEDPKLHQEGPPAGQRP